MARYRSAFARQIDRERAEREAAYQRAMRERHEAELAVRRTMPRCPTTRCVDAIAKHGDNYLRVYVCDGFSAKDGSTHRCEGCGGRLNGDAWVHRCHECGKDVEPGALTGLFVPHKCRECEATEADAERARGAVCRGCGNPFSRCYC